MEAFKDYRLEAWLDEDGLFKRIESKIIKSSMVKGFRSFGIVLATAGAVFVGYPSASGTPVWAPDSSVVVPPYQSESLMESQAQEQALARVFALSQQMDAGRANFFNPDSSDVNPSLLAYIEGRLAKKAST